MTQGIIRVAAFTIKGGLLGFALGLAGAIFGTIIGNSFESIWASGMPVAMAALGMVIFGILSGIGMHNSEFSSYQKSP